LERICSRRVSLVILVAVLANGRAASAAGWAPPLGIPPPAFGIVEAAPAAPNPWTVDVPGFYYVDQYAPGASDAHAYGNPGAPRQTIPLSLPAGSVVEVHGQYDVSHGNPSGITLNGTATQPVFVRGSAPNAKPVITGTWQVKGSCFILENLEFAFQVAVKGALLLTDTTMGVLRLSDVHGNLNGGGVAVVASKAVSTTNVVIYGNLIHDNGDVQATFDQDIHGIRVGSGVNQLWVVDNELYRNSGDGIQINAGSAAAQPTTHHIYVGRNVSHDNKQSGFWTKQAVDVIISQNLSYAHRPSNSSYGPGMGFQYAPERVWFLFNHIHDCDFGIGGSSDNGQGTGQDSFFIGNVIHDIHHSGSYNPNTAWSNAGIMLAGGVNRYVINNTIHDVDAGINSPGTAGSIHVVDNVVSHVTEPQGNHIFLEFASLAQSSTVLYDILEGTVRIRWGSSTVYNLPRFQGAFPPQGLACLNDDPLFVDPLNEDFHLVAGSPAVDAGVTDLVYSTFLSRYGIDIAKDADGSRRPQGTAFDLGAYEGPFPDINIGDVTVKEGNSGTVNATFIVSLSSTTGRTVTVNYATADNTATAPSDYIAAAGTLSFVPGTSTQTITVTVNGDTLVEPTETFYVNLSGAVNATIADGQGKGTITNDDSAVIPSLSINDVVVTEGNSGTKNAVFTVSLSAASSETVTVRYATANGSATAPSDYVATSGTLSFAPGIISRTVTVAVKGDTLVEPNETFFVNLTGASGATIADGQGKGTILNDDFRGLREAAPPE